MQINKNSLLRSCDNFTKQNQDVKQTNKEKTLWFKEYEDGLDVVDISSDEKKAEESAKYQQEISLAQLSMGMYKSRLMSNQQVAQYGNCAFAKMITDTTDLAGLEIITNFSALTGSITTDVNRIKHAVDEALAKLEVLLNLSNAAVQASDILQKMHEAGIDDSEMMQLFEDYANNMNTSIDGVSEASNKNNKSDSKNISNSKEDSEIDNKIQELKDKIREETEILNNDSSSEETKQNAEIQIEANNFLIDEYTAIKKAIKPLNKGVFGNLSKLFG